jgi:hypothetical protein
LPAASCQEERGALHWGRNSATPPPTPDPGGFDLWAPPARESIRSFSNEGGRILSTWNCQGAISDLHHRIDSDAVSCGPVPKVKPGSGGEHRDPGGLFHSGESMRGSQSPVPNRSDPGADYAPSTAAVDERRFARGTAMATFEVPSGTKRPLNGPFCRALKRPPLRGGLCGAVEAAPLQIVTSFALRECKRRPS